MNMSIIVDGSKKYIVDRTLEVIAKKNRYISSSEASYFISLLRSFGVDIVELNYETIDKVKSFPSCMNYAYRIEEDLHAVYVNKLNFKYIIIDYRKAVNYTEDYANRFNYKNIILDIDIEDLDCLYLDETKKIFSRFNIKAIRIKNIKKYNLVSWESTIKNLKQHFLVQVAFCADNSFFMATAISVEGCIDGADFITTNFNGGENGYAPLEEIILALKVIMHGILCGNSKLLKQLTNSYKQLTKEEIYCMKAVLGDDIFKYESGVHADGIAKNPLTYEPYNPMDIGKIRKMYIGKHSGKKAVMLRLKELNVNYSEINMEDFLIKIRQKSIELKRNILNNELIEMCISFKNP